MDMINVMRQAVAVTATEAEEILARTRPQSLAKGEVWLAAGQVCEQIGFLHAGTLRIYYLDPEGKEVTCYFFQAGEFFASYNSYVAGLPSNENIQALTDCELYTLDRKDLEELMARIPAVDQYMRSVGDRLVLEMEGRIRYLQNAGAEQRYRHLMEQHPRLLRDVPLQYLASYLGITPQHMSRLRKQSMQDAK